MTVERDPDEVDCIHCDCERWEEQEARDAAAEERFLQPIKQDPIRDALASGWLEEE